MKTTRTILTIGAAVIALAGTSLARTWTSADGKSTFEGEFVSATGDKVTVKRAKGKVTFDVVHLSDADQEYVKEEISKAQAIADAKAESEKLKSAAVPKALSRKLVKLDEKGKKYEKFDLEEGIIPEYYVVYSSASW